MLYGSMQHIAIGNIGCPSDDEEHHYDNTLDGRQLWLDVRIT